MEVVDQDDSRRSRVERRKNGARERPVGGRNRTNENAAGQGRNFAGGDHAGGAVTTDNAGERHTGVPVRRPEKGHAGATARAPACTSASGTTPVPSRRRFLHQRG